MKFHGLISRCDCVICRLARALEQPALERETVGPLVDEMLDAWARDEARLAHLLDGARRMCARLDAPEYLRRAYDATKERR